MIDPRCEAVLIADQDTGQFADQTHKVVRYEAQSSGKINLVYGGDRAYLYGLARVRILRNPARVPLPPGAKVEVRGAIWDYVTEVWVFTGPVGAWWRIFSRRQAGEVYHTYPASQVRIVMSAAQAPAAAEVLRYWWDIVSRLPDDDPLRRQYGGLNFVHPESVLGCYLAGAPIASREPAPLAIFPFRCNLSQRKAVDLGLTPGLRHVWEMTVLGGSGDWLGLG